MQQKHAYMAEPYWIRTRASLLRPISTCEATGCWRWVGFYDGKGRPILAQGSSRRLAMQMAYVAFVGPTYGRAIVRTCDNPRCVRPEHLKLGARLSTAKATNGGKSS